MTPPLLHNDQTRPSAASERLSRNLPLGLLLAGAAALAVDLPLSRAILAGGVPRWLLKTCSLSEVFAHGLGVGLIAVAVFTLDPARRVALPRLLTAAFGAGLCSNVFKLLIARARPQHFDFSGGVFSTFGTWLPLGRGGSSLQSFPSSHAATAAGLALALAWLYPHGRRLFVLFATLACLQRLFVGAHFASDVLIGSAVGCAFARQCLGDRAVGRFFDRWEARLRERFERTPLNGSGPATIPIRSAEPTSGRRGIRP
jgi:membrane-associated phospholipid phosphatase